MIVCLILIFKIFKGFNGATCNNDGGLHITLPLKETFRVVVLFSHIKPFNKDIYNHI